MELGLVSFVGVDLTHVEFHNVKFFHQGFRTIIVDEFFLPNNRNYEEVSKVYNELGKNYESKLSFNEASYFFMGEMEAIRRSYVRGPFGRKLISIPYFLYKLIALYGESISLPLVIWTPLVIGWFAYLRYSLGICSAEIEKCGTLDPLVDSIAAYFQIPRDDTNYDVLERIISAPILGSAFIAIRREFERKK